MNKTVGKLLALLIETTGELESYITDEGASDATKDLVKRSKKAIAHAQGLVKKDAKRRDAWNGEPHIALVRYTNGKQEVWGFRYLAAQVTNHQWTREDAERELRSAPDRYKEKYRKPIPNPIPLIEETFADA